MPTDRWDCGLLPVEGRELDAEGCARREALTELVLREYETSGTLSAVRVCEAVQAFEAYAAQHVKPD